MSTFKKMISELNIFGQKNSAELNVYRQCMILFAGLAAAGIIFFQVHGSAGIIKGKAESRRQLSQEIAVLVDQLVSAKQTFKSDSVNTKIDSLLAWLEKQINNAALSEKLKRISPVSDAGAELNSFKERALVSFESITMAELLNFVKTLEDTAGVEVIKSDIRRPARNTSGLFFTVEVGLY